MQNFDTITKILDHKMDKEDFDMLCHQMDQKSDKQDIDMYVSAVSN